MTTHAYKTAVVFTVLAGTMLLCAQASAAPKKRTDAVAEMLANTKPITKVKDRHPLFFWTPRIAPKTSDAQLRMLLLKIHARGVSLYQSWGRQPKKELAEAIRMAKLQEQLGMPVVVDATGMAHGFYSKDESLSHVDKDGKPFRDSTFFWRPGCPFVVESEIARKRALSEQWAKGYKEAGIKLDYWMADWEFDGPNEWNGGWEAAKRCTRCRERVPNIDDFAAFQSKVREIRTRLQLKSFVEPVTAVYPKVWIGNYAMNPNDGFRYFWDYYEEKERGKPFIVEGVNYRRHHGAYIRPWANEFPASGYNLSMAVVYSWYNLYADYDFENRQYRWFYPMLMEFTSTVRGAPEALLHIPFVHWSPVNTPKEKPADLEPLTQQNYEELLWHMYLRGADSFAMWSPARETASEVVPVHKVFAESMDYSEFITKGEPKLFDVPGEPGTVVSAMKLGDRLLVRRTDFVPLDAPVTVVIDGKNISVPPKPGQCQVLKLK